MKAIIKLMLVSAAFFSASVLASVEIVGFTVSEAAGTGTWNVTASVQNDASLENPSGDSGINAQLDYETRDGTAEDENGDDDYKAQSGTLDFSSNATQQITIDIVQDAKIEGDQNFFVDLFETPGVTVVPASPQMLEAPAGLKPAAATGTGNIIDDDIELKVFVEGANSDVDVLLDCAGNGTIDDATKTTSGGMVTFEVINYLDPLNCTATPTSTPGGSYLAASDCNPGLDEAITECTLVFATTRATFKVTKTFADGNDVDEVEVVIDCNTGLILDQDKDLGDGDSVEFVVTSFDDGTLNCTITEDGQAGYAGEYTTIGDPNVVNAISCEYLAVGGGDAYECEIVNTPLPVEVNVYKDWVFSGNSAPDINTYIELVMWCTSEISTADCGVTGPASDSTPFDSPAGSEYTWYSYCHWNTGLNDLLFTSTVIPAFPSTQCVVTEYVYDQAIEQDNGCGTFEVKVLQGKDCTITNTVFYEGIPTLSQYGMALMALLMLGVGFVSFRRFS